jgi:hypothetical protein
VQIALSDLGEWLSLSIPFLDQIRHVDAIVDGLSDTICTGEFVEVVDAFMTGAPLEVGAEAADDGQRFKSGSHRFEDLFILHV